MPSLSDHSFADACWRAAEQQTARRIAYEEDVRILYGQSALVTGIPGPHARRRKAAVGEENRLAERIAEHGNRHA